MLTDTSSNKYTGMLNALTHNALQLFSGRWSKILGLNGTFTY